MAKISSASGPSISSAGPLHGGQRPSAIVGALAAGYYDCASVMSGNLSKMLGRSRIGNQATQIVYPACIMLAVTLRGAAETPRDASERPAPIVGTRSAESAATPERVRQLIAELSADEYAARQQAFEQLLAAGVVAREPLLRIAEGPDPEKRASARRLVKLIDRSEFQRHLDAFAADVDGRQKQSLPGWEQYQKLVGDRPSDRALFVEMQRHEGALLATVFGVATRPVEEIWESRLQRIVQWQASVGERASSPPLGSCAAMLFLGSRKELNVSDSAVISIDSLLQRPPVKQLLAREASHDAFRRLLACWVLNCPANSEMALGCRLRAIGAAGLDECLPLAISIAGSEPDYSRATPLTRASAALLVGQLGSRKHVHPLEPLLEDSAICIGMTGQIANGSTVQVRDVALAVLLHLTGQSPADYGYLAARMQPPGLFVLDSLYRQNDEERNAAIAKWRAWRSTNK